MQVMDWTGLDWTGWKFNREKTGTDQPEYTIPHTRSWILTSRSGRTKIHPGVHGRSWHSLRHSEHSARVRSGRDISAPSRPKGGWLSTGDSRS